MTWYIVGFVATLLALGIFKKDEGPFWTRGFLMQCAAGGLVVYLIALGLGATGNPYGTDYESCVMGVSGGTPSEAAAKRLAYGCRLYHSGDRDLGRCYLDGLRGVQSDHAAKVIASACETKHRK